MSEYSIRSAREQDCVEIAHLATQLGYPASIDVMRSRLQRLLANPGDAVFVAEIPDGKLAGWIHGVLSQFLESEFRVEIAGLVVDKQFHRKGIGRDLVERVETWAVSHGATQSSVRCQTKRTDAHQFYASLGYTETKRQIVFRKPLSPRANKAPKPTARRIL